MKYFGSHAYKDDRIYVLELLEMTKGNLPVWAVFTRRNTEKLPTIKIKYFSTKASAVEYVKSTEPSLPLISLYGEVPIRPKNFEDHYRDLKSAGLNSALDRVYSRPFSLSDFYLATTTSLDYSEEFKKQPPDEFINRLAHQILPILVLGNPKKFYSRVNRHHPENYLLDLWYQFVYIYFSHILFVYLTNNLLPTLNPQQTVSAHSPAR